MAATFSPETSREGVREMLRTLLAERFRLKIHYGERTLESYALVVDRRGPMIHEGSTGKEGALIFGDDHVIARAISMPELSGRLSGLIFKLDRPVVKMTGTNTLNWSPDGTAAGKAKNQVQHSCSRFRRQGSRQQLVC